ncbi:uncharacterized protein KY384_008802 [Bacidia gigantensis]|uniref:uncharacterized protein n=1 Tax=Bacidia gigantensis TaxID=2732470 RepID=UPI001D043B10|nr:uncharacterized protein KY384_008802 [Bacidia gigantensis]KAG8526601.1 hypothetical protein KY384_008802 [Bacidia gigantensis]
MNLETGYRSFSDYRERRDELRRLVQSLSFSDRRYLFDIITNDAKLDVFGQLPAEICDSIIQHLPLRQCFRARRVSRRWNERLTSLHAINGKLRRWSSSTAPLNSAELTSKANKVAAFTRGSPFSMKQITIPKHAHSLKCRAGYLVWDDMIHGERRQVTSINMESGLEQILMMPNRETIRCIELSATMLVALVDAGRCYVWDLSDSMSVQQPRCLQLENTNGVHLAVSNTSIAFHPFFPQGWRGRQNPPNWPTVRIWDRDSESMTEFGIPHMASARFIVSLTFSLDGRSILLLRQLKQIRQESVRTDKVPYSFYRINLRGEVLSEGLQVIFTYPIPKNLEPADVKFVQGAFDASSVLLHTTNFTTSPWELQYLCYDCENDRLRVDSFNVKAPLLDNSTEAVHVWRDVMYINTRLNIFSSKTILRVIDLGDNKTQTDCHDWPATDVFGGIRSGRKGKLLGDETFLIHLIGNTAYIMCFDKDLRMVDEDVEFRQRRQQELEARFAKRRQLT